MDKPTYEEIIAAWVRGHEDYGTHGVSHHGDGKLIGPYKHGEHHPDLIDAWARGFDRARIAAIP